MGSVSSIAVSPRIRTPLISPIAFRARARVPSRSPRLDPRAMYATSLIPRPFKGHLRVSERSRHGNLRLPGVDDDFLNTINPKSLVRHGCHEVFEVENVIASYNRRHNTINSARVENGCRTQRVFVAGHPR